MVATRATSQAKAVEGPDADLRRCIRDMVALSSLPGIWIKADAKEITQSLAQIVVSILDADCAYVFLSDPLTEIAQFHDRIESLTVDMPELRKRCRPNSTIEIDEPTLGRLRGACLPIGREPGASLVVLSARIDFPTETEQMLIRVAVNQAAVAIDRRRIENKTLQQNRVLQKLHETGVLVAANLETQTIIQAVTDAATDLSGAQFGAFFYSETTKTGEQYMLYTLSGASREDFSRFPMPRNTAIFDPTFRGVGVVRSANIRTDARYGKNYPYRGMPDGHLPVTSYLAVPVISRTGFVFGGLFFGHEREGVFSEESESIVRGIAAQAAIALDNARLYQAARTEIEERQRIEAHQNVLLAELSHRVKNTLAIVQSMATQTLRYSSSPEAFNVSFMDRLLALSSAHNLLIENNWAGAPLRVILSQVLIPFAGADSRYQLDGPDVMLTPQDSVSAVLILHELSTNCVKYGAWSVPAGKVLISWTDGDERPDIVIVKWQEADGPPVAPPGRRGLGSVLLERAAAGSCRGSLRFSPSGVHFEFALRRAAGPEFGRKANLDRDPVEYMKDGSLA